MPRQIKDTVVLDRCLKLNGASSVVNLSLYDGYVDDPEQKIFLSKPVNVKRSTLIDGVRSIYDYYTFDGNTGTITVEDVDFPVHSNIIKVIKACVIGSVNPCDSFCSVVSNFSYALLKECVSSEVISIPIYINTSGNMEKVLLDELNAFLIEVLEKSDIPYVETIDTTRNRAAKKKAKSDKKNKSALETLAEGSL